MKTLKEVVEHLLQIDALEHATEWLEGSFAAKPVKSFHEVALEASKVTGGQWSAYPKAAHWQLGKRSMWIVAPSQTKGIIEARAVVKSITGECHKLSVGGCATQLIKWAIDTENQSKELCHHFGDTALAYHECKAGKYPDMAYYDMSGCYYHLFDRVPSPKMRVLSSGRVVAQPLSKQEAAKWKEIRAAMADFKLLRNSVWGCGLGNIDGAHYYCKGEKRYRGGFAGPLHVAALLVARLAYELTICAAYDTGAVYAQTDGVICPGTSFPRLWESCGVHFGLKAMGDADVRLQHQYKIGDVYTKPYRQFYGTFTHDTPRAPLPAKMYHHEFLL